MNKTMNKTALAAALVSALGCVASTASAQAFGDVARVISATPLYERASVPRRDCRVEPVTAYEERRTETRRQKLTSFHFIPPVALATSVSR